MSVKLCARINHIGEIYGGDQVIVDDVTSDFFKAHVVSKSLLKLWQSDNMSVAMRL